MPVEIKHRYTHAVIGTGDTIRAAVLANIRCLRDADLRFADLRCADLRDADLRGAYLGGADLRSADLRDADLRGADLRGADLRGADLRSAYLGGADLRFADLRSAKIAWQSHDLLAELLYRAAGDDIAKIKIAGFVLIQRKWCWMQFASHAKSDPLGWWALDTLAAWVQEDDGAPDLLRTEKARLDAASKEGGDA